MNPNIHGLPLRDYDKIYDIKFALIRIVCGKILFLEHYAQTKYWLNGKWNVLSESLLCDWIKTTEHGLKKEWKFIEEIKGD